MPKEAVLRYMGAGGQVGDDLRRAQIEAFAHYLGNFCVGQNSRPFRIDKDRNGLATPIA